MRETQAFLKQLPKAIVFFSIKYGKIGYPFNKKPGASNSGFVK